LSDETIPQSVLFSDLFDRPLVATFDQAHASSDGGAILLKAADARLGVTAALAGCLTDGRTSTRIAHTVQDLVAQRVFGIACGYPDANDADRLADDPIQKLLLDRDPIAGTPLASQPTISRFENGVSRTALYQMGQALAIRVVDRHHRRLHGRARHITIDLDPTDDPTHGAQQLSFFNGHYDTWCYLPLLAFVTFNQEREQYLCAAILRPGNASASLGALGVLRRLVPLLRTAFPKARLRVRLDGGFACPAVFEFLELERLDYVVAMGKNAVLDRAAAPAMIDARALHALSGQTAHVYTDSWYQARTWSQSRRVIIKAEVVQHPGREPRDNPRFIVTNLHQRPQWLYETVYCARGDIENRIKELHHDLAIGRTSCSRFWANQLRVLLTAAAYVLMQELRLRAARTSCARAQVGMLRLRLFKLGARVVGSARRIVLHLPVSSPYGSTWQRVALSLGARAG
jgi:Transposase DDE domain group 1